MIMAGGIFLPGSEGDLHHFMSGLATVIPASLPFVTYSEASATT